MYLYREIYIGAKYAHNNINGTVDIFRAFDKIDISLDRISSIIEEVGYWRKANAIHKWFVDNVQSGVDECQRGYVSREQLKELRDTCAAVLADHSKAEELLPPSSGFFFGGTDIDSYYFDVLEATINILDDLGEGHDRYYYQSSW